MNLRFIDTSVVITGNQHNPTLLHPSFLSSRGIVPANWTVLDDEVVCSPAMSQVQYSNGILFTVDPNRLQIRDQKPKENIVDSILPNISKEYIRALPHVPYKSVGINFAGGVERENSGTWLRKRFLTNGKWNNDDFYPINLSLTFQYIEDGSRINSTISPGQFTILENQYVGTILTVNYHTDLEEAAMLESAENALSQFGERYQHFIQIANTLLGSD